MKSELVSIICEQTKILFINIEETMQSIEEAQLYNEDICDWPLGEQIYHMVHSLDQWFINPNRYVETKLASLETEKVPRISKAELNVYCSSTKAKIMTYLAHLSTESLDEQPPGCQFSRLALILGQYRHLMYHIGLIHGCLRVNTKGENPAFIGLGTPIRPVT